ncbi:hypothetical protein [Streptomyces sp. NPDC056491]
MSSCTIGRYRVAFEAGGRTVMAGWSALFFLVLPILAARYRRR